MAASITVATNVLRVTFDRPLFPGASAPGNWQYRKFGFPPTNWHNAVPAVIAGSTVTAQLALGGVDPPVVELCKYNAAPADVLRTDPPRLPAAAFTDFVTAKI